MAAQFFTRRRGFSSDNDDEFIFLQRFLTLFVLLSRSAHGLIFMLFGGWKFNPLAARSFVVA